MNRTLKGWLLWFLILGAAGIAFFTSFNQSIDTASIVRTDDDGILRVRVMNVPESPGNALLLKIEYTDAEKKSPSGDALAKPFPQPFVAVLVDGKNQIVAILPPPDAAGNVPAIQDFPRSEKYFWVGFPKILVDGKPASLLIRNPFF